MAKSSYEKIKELYNKATKPEADAKELTASLGALLGEVELPPEIQAKVQGMYDQAVEKLGQSEDKKED